jgi:hypothetical protein
VPTPAECCFGNTDAWLEDPSSKGYRDQQDAFWAPLLGDLMLVKTGGDLTDILDKYLVDPDTVDIKPGIQ